MLSLDLGGPLVFFLLLASVHLLVRTPPSCGASLSSLSDQDLLLYIAVQNAEAAYLLLVIWVFQSMSKMQLDSEGVPCISFEDPSNFSAE